MLWIAFGHYVIFCFCTGFWIGFQNKIVIFDLRFFGFRIESCIINRQLELSIVQYWLNSFLKKTNEYNFHTLSKLPAKFSSFDAVFDEFRIVPEAMVFENCRSSLHEIKSRPKYSQLLPDSEHSNFSSDFASPRMSWKISCKLRNSPNTSNLKLCL